MQCCYAYWSHIRKLGAGYKRGVPWAEVVCQANKHGGQFEMKKVQTLYTTMHTIQPILCRRIWRSIAVTTRVVLALIFVLKCLLWHCLWHSDKFVSVGTPYRTILLSNTQTLHACHWIWITYWKNLLTLLDYCQQNHRWITKSLHFIRFIQRWKVDWAVLPGLHCMLSLWL